MKTNQIFVWLLVLGSTLFAQKFSVEYYNYEDGLPSDLIKQTIQDNLGFVWFATDGGLARFDGLRFKVFDRQLPSRYVKSIFPLKKDTLMVCTDQGLVLVKERSIKVDITPIFKASPDLSDSALYYPKSIYRDHKNNLWISEPNSVARILSGNKIKRYRFPDYVESKSYLNSFFFLENERQDLLLLSQSGFAFFYDSKSDSFIQVTIKSHSAFHAINDVYKLENDRCFLATSQGVYELSFSDPTALRARLRFKIKNVLSLTIDRAGYLWMGTSGSGLYYAPNWQKSSAVISFDKLKFKVINDLYVSKGGQIWAGSDNGVALIYKPFFEKIVGFSNYAIQNLAYDEKKHIVATNGQEVYQLSEHPGRYQLKLRLKSSDALFSTIGVNSREIVLGNFNGNITLLRKGFRRNISLVTNHTVFSLATDRDNTIWITQGDFKGLTRLRPPKNIEVMDERSGLQGFPVVVKAFSNKLYIGGSGDSTYLYEYRLNQKKLVNLSLPLSKLKNVTPVVYDIALSALDSTIFLASNLGIIKIKNTTASILRLDRNRAARSALVDRQNRLWVGTDHGAYCIKDTVKVYFDDLAGFENQTFAFRSVALDTQDKIYFGTYDGIYRQQIDSFTIEKTSSPQIVDLIINEARRLSLKDLKQGLEYKTTLRVLVAALMFPAHKVEYQWRIPGVNNSWSAPDARSEILVSNLPIGNFELQIRARQIGKAWSPVFSLPLRINAPWYLSKWLIILLASLFVLMILISTQLYYERRARKKIAGHLEKSEFQLKTIISNTPIILFLIDTKGKVTFAQGRGLNELEEEFKPLVGQNICRQSHSGSGLEEDCRRALNGESFESIRKLGKKYYRFWFSPIKDGKNKIEGALGVAIDITELKETESRLRHAIIQAEASNKAKSEFIANMSHELRTPLNAIIGLIDLMDQSNLNETQKEFLQTVKFSARELLKIINQILDFSKIESGKLELEFIPFDLEQLVTHIANAFSIMARQKGLTFKLEWDKNNPKHVKGDPTRLGQVLINLIGNAIKFTEKGSVTLKVIKKNESENEVDFLFVVQDTGIGIPQDKIDKIFNSFEQVDSSLTRKFGGTGLGLTITSRLIEMMGSKIKVSSQPDVGTTFEFELTFPKVKDQKVEELPDFSLFLTHEQPRLSSEMMITESEPQKETKEDEVTILLVEDNVINQRVAKRMVENMGYKVEVANHGQEALDMMKNKKYDLVLLDVQMPVLDGLRTAQKIRVKELNTEEHIPIIAMTAHAQKEDRDRCLEAGMDDYLSKPINMKMLEEKINHYLKNAKNS